MGLALAYALPLTGTLNGLIGSFTGDVSSLWSLLKTAFRFTFSETEKEIVSVERTIEYMHIAPEEDPQASASKVGI